MPKGARCSAWAPMRPSCIRSHRRRATTWCCRWTWRRSRPPRTVWAITAAPWSRMDPSNGDVLALASKPGFDPAAFARGLTRSEYAALANDRQAAAQSRAARRLSVRLDHQAGDRAGGADLPLVDPNKPEFCNGVFHLPGSSLLFREGRSGRHGWLDLTHAIARSCDVYFYGLAATLGVEPHRGLPGAIRLRPAHRHRHQRRETGAAALARVEEKRIQEARRPGLVPGRDRQLRRRPGLPAGHAAAARARRRRAGRARQELPPAPGDRHARYRAARSRRSRRSPIPRSRANGRCDWDLVINGMVGRRLRYGTAAAIVQGCPATRSRARPAPPRSTRSRAARTLTEQVAEQLRDHAWFIAFAPAEEPRIAVAVLVENGGFGASAAAPIARKVMDAYLLRHEHAPARIDRGARIAGAPTESDGNTMEDYRLRAHTPHAVCHGAAAVGAQSGRAAAGRLCRCWRSTVSSFSTAPRVRASIPSCAR